MQNCKYLTFKIRAHGLQLHMRMMFYIRMVLEVASSEVATIQFLNRGFQTVYRWPRTDDVADVQVSLFLLLILG